MPNLLYAHNNAYDTILLTNDGTVVSKWDVTAETLASYLPGRHGDDSLGVADLRGWDVQDADGLEPSDPTAYGEILEPDTPEWKARIAFYLEAELDRLAGEIRGWDMEDVADLRDSLRELDRAITTANGADGRQRESTHYIDTTDLPSADIPDDIDTSYPVWAMDRHGICLVGETLSDIEPLDEIREHYEIKTK